MTGPRCRVLWLGYWVVKCDVCGYCPYPCLSTDDADDVAREHLAVWHG